MSGYGSQAPRAAALALAFDGDEAAAGPTAF